MSSDDAHAKALATVKAMLAEALPLVEGCREMVRLLGGLHPKLAGSEAALIFVAVESETDTHPVGDARLHWNADTLRERDAELDGYLDSVRGAVLDACRDFERRLSEP